jgi:hypothetical protein
MFYNFYIRKLVKARVLVHDKPFQSSLMLLGKARSLQHSRALLRRSIRVGFDTNHIMRLEWKGLPSTNTSLLRIRKLRT